MMTFLSSVTKNSSSNTSVSSAIWIPGLTTRADVAADTVVKCSGVCGKGAGSSRRVDIVRGMGAWFKSNSGPISARDWSSSGLARLAELAVMGAIGGVLLLLVEIARHARFGRGVQHRLEARRPA